MLFPFSGQVWKWWPWLLLHILHKRIRAELHIWQWQSNHKYCICFGFANVVYLPQLLLFCQFVWLYTLWTPVLVMYLDFLSGWNVQCLDLYSRFQWLILSLDGQSSPNIFPQTADGHKNRPAPNVSVVSTCTLQSAKFKWSFKLNFLAPAFLFQEERIGNVNVKCTF